MNNGTAQGTHTPPELTEPEARVRAMRAGWIYREQYAVIDDGLVLVLDLRRGNRRRRVTELCASAFHRGRCESAGAASRDGGTMRLQDLTDCPAHAETVLHRHPDGRWWIVTEQGDREIGGFRTREKAERFLAGMQRRLDAEHARELARANSDASDLAWWERRPGGDSIG